MPYLVTFLKPYYDAIETLKKPGESVVVDLISTTAQLNDFLRRRKRFTGKVYKYRTHNLRGKARIWRLQ